MLGIESPQGERGCSLVSNDISDGKSQKCFNLKRSHFEKCQSVYDYYLTQSVRIQYSSLTVTKCLNALKMNSEATVVQFKAVFQVFLLAFASFAFMCKC